MKRCPTWRWLARKPSIAANSTASTTYSKRSGWRPRDPCATCTAPYCKSASPYYQLERGNFRGALKMLQRSVQWLHPLPDACQGIDVAALRRDSYAVRAELQRLGPQRLDEFDRSLLKPLQLTSLQ